jgi:hypothetical protein
MGRGKLRALPDSFTSQRSLSAVGLSMDRGAQRFLNLPALDTAASPQIQVVTDWEASLKN